jgi:hypothetical protein
MEMHHTRSSGDNNCEISQLDSEKLIADTHWEYVRSDQDRFTCVADKNGIIICRYTGWSIKTDYDRLEEVINEIIISIKWQEKPWVLLLDCSALTGMDIAAREKLIQLLSLQRYLKGVLFCSPSHLIKSLVRLAATFYKPSFKIEVYKTTADGYFRAGELLGISSGQRFHPEQNILSEESGDNENEIDQVLRILGNVEWNKPGIELLEKAAENTIWKPFLSMMAIIKGDLDVMIQRPRSDGLSLKKTILRK